MFWKKLACAAILIIVPKGIAPMYQNVQGASGMRGLVISTEPAAPPPTTGFTFTPPGAHYVGNQNIVIAYTPSPSGTSIFYTLDGTAASEASQAYSSAIPLAITTTINALAATTGTVRQETQALAVTNTSAGWKLCTPVASSSNGTPTSGNSSICGGGVGSDQPSTWTVTTGTTESISVSSTSGAPQILVTLGGSGCDNCVEETMDKWVIPIASVNGTAQNHEMDTWHVDATRHVLHMGGLQCNQQTGILQWQIDNEQGSWQNLSPAITQGCPLSTTLWTHVIYHIHWIIGDTGCGDGHSPGVGGGMGCTYYDWLALGQASTPRAAGTVMTVHTINRTLESDTKNWGAGCSDQDQVDLRPGGTYPKTAGIKIQHNNVTCSLSQIATGSAAYTF